MHVETEPLDPAAPDYPGAAAPAPAPTPPEPDLVDGDVACRRCGYNLRGCRHRGDCPECGSRVAPSTLGDDLGYAEPRWLATIARGAATSRQWLIFTIVVCFAAACASVLPPDAALAAVVAVYCAGTWQLTSPDPSGWEPRLPDDVLARIAGQSDHLPQAVRRWWRLLGGRPPDPRPLARACCIVAAGALLVAGFLNEFAPARDFELLGVDFVLLGALAGAEVAKWLYLDRLVARLSHDALAKLTRERRNHIAISVGVFAAVAVAVHVASVLAPRTAGSNLLALVWVLSLAVMLRQLIDGFSVQGQIAAAVGEKRLLAEQVWEIDGRPHRRLRERDGLARVRVHPLEQVQPLQRERVGRVA